MPVNKEETKQFIQETRKKYRKHLIEKTTRRYVEKHGWKEDEARFSAEGTYSTQFMRNTVKTRGDAQRALKIM